jgi:hypothetical protein
MTDHDTSEMELESFDEKENQNWSNWNYEKLTENKNDKNKEVLSLHDQCSRTIARNIPFELVQNYFPPVPEHSQVS